MSQRPTGDYPIDPTATTGSQLATILNAQDLAIASNHLGGTRPPYITKGGLWSKQNADGSVELFIYTGTADVSLSSPSLAWGSITGKPATFPPTIGGGATDAAAGNHAHVWTAITGKPTTFPPIIGNTATTAAAGNHVHTWTQITGKPATFPPTIGTGPNDAAAGDHNHDNWYYRQTLFINTRAGATDANKPVKTDASGYVNPTFLNLTGLNFLGVVDPASLPAVPAKGDFVVFNKAGTVNGQNVQSNDMAVYDGVQWDIIPNERNLAAYLLKPAVDAVGWLHRRADGTNTWKGVTWAEVSGKPTTWAWSAISGKPATFPPTIGTTATTAAAGNHNHDTKYLKLTGGTVAGNLTITGPMGNSNLSGSGRRMVTASPLGVLGTAPLPTVAPSLWKTTGTNNEIYYDKGSVGIGNNAPNCVLDVGKDTDPADYFRFRSVFPHICCVMGTGPSAQGHFMFETPTQNVRARLGYAQSTNQMSLVIGSTYCISMAQRAPNTGLVGMNKSSPNYECDVNGTLAYVNGPIKVSDKKFKENITPLADGATALVRKLKPVTFDFKQDDGDITVKETKQRKKYKDGQQVLDKNGDPVLEDYTEDVVLYDGKNFDSKRQIGFVAQDVEKIPELANLLVTTTPEEAVVYEGETLRPATDFKSLQQEGMIPLLTKALQEALDKIDALEARIAKLEA